MKTDAAVALAGALALSVAGAVPALARDGDVIERGSCSGSADWKLKLSPEDRKIEVEYEVDSNVNGQSWKVKIFKNGDRIFRDAHHEGAERLVRRPRRDFGPGRLGHVPRQGGQRRDRRGLPQPRRSRS